MDSLYAFCHSYNRGSKIEVHRATGFKEIIEPLKKYVLELAEATNAQKTIIELKSEIERLKKDKDSVNDRKNRLYEAKGKNGNSIYLPAAGYRYEKLVNEGMFGDYWTHSIFESNSDRAWSLNFNSDNLYLDYHYHRNGFLVRAVRCRN